jgi:hypothetical protein
VEEKTMHGEEEGQSIVMLSSQKESTLSLNDNTRKGKKEV